MNKKEAYQEKFFYGYSAFKVLTSPGSIRKPGA